MSIEVNMNYHRIPELNRNKLGGLFQEHYKNGVGVEIGLLWGDYALKLFENGWKGKIVGIDIWRDVEHMARAFKNLENTNSIMIKSTSIEASKIFARNSLDWIYIDGDHTYEAVKNDLNNWYPKVRKGGIIAGHDYTSDEEKAKHPELEFLNNGSVGVVQAVDEFCKEKGYAVNVIHETALEADYASFWFKK